MSDLPEPPPVNSPFGSPGSGWSGGSGPFDSTSSGAGGRRRLLVVVLVVSVVAVAVLVASVFLRDDSSTETSPSGQPSNEQSGTLEPEASVLPPEATVAPSSTAEPSSPSTHARPESAPSSQPASLPDDVDLSSETLFEGDRISVIVEDIAAARGADPLRVLKMLIYPEYVFSDVQDPTLLENVDRFEWRGELRTPEPVRLDGVDDLDVSLFSADEVNWSAIATLVAGAPEAVQIPDGEVTHVVVQRPIPFSNDVEMRVFVTGARANGFVDADANGVVIAIDGQAVDAVD